jgi:hypothetical protein
MCVQTLGHNVCAEVDLGWETETQEHRREVISEITANEEAEVDKGKERKRDRTRDRVRRRRNHSGDEHPQMHRGIK